MDKTKITLDDRELAAVLAGLRMLQLEVKSVADSSNWIDQEIHDIYTDADSLVGLDSDEIDSLCERLNIGE